MTEPKVVLKNVRMFRGMEGYGLNADVYINGVKCTFVIDSGDGGCMDYEDVQTPAAKANLKLLNDYIKTLPPETCTDFGKPFTIKIDLDTYINNVLVRQDNEKQHKKMEKLYNSAIVFGVPNADKYQYLNFKRPLKEVPTMLLQRKVNEVQLTYCKKGVKILNTNFGELGISIP